MMLITFGIHLYEICTKNVFLICLVYFQNYAAIKKKKSHNMTKRQIFNNKKLRIPRKRKIETLKQLKIRTDMNSDSPYESAVRTSLIILLPDVISVNTYTI
jgi:hypothetical protein